MSRPWCRNIPVIAFVAIATLAAACTTWRPLMAPLPVATESRPDPAVRLKLSNGATVTMYSPQLKDDSIIGYDQPSTQHATNRIAMLRTDVITVSVGKFDFWKTFRNSIGVYAVLVIIALIGADREWF